VHHPVRLRKGSNLLSIHPLLHYPGSGSRPGDVVEETSVTPRNGPAQLYTSLRRRPFLTGNLFGGGLGALGFTVTRRARATCSVSTPYALSQRPAELDVVGGVSSFGFLPALVESRRGRHPTGHERMSSPTLQTLQKPILLLPWVLFQTQTKVAEASRCLSLPYSYMQGPVGGLTHVRRLHLARVWVVCHRRRRRQGRGRRRWQRRVMQMKRVHRSGSGLTHSRRLHPHLHGCAQSLITPREQVMIKL
jgi:hypothetical protein